jgi:hypothetical protein
MLVSAHDGGVNYHVFVVMIAGQEIENPLENAALGPSVEALIDDLPVAKALGQIAPRDAGAKPEENGSKTFCRAAKAMWAGRRRTIACSSKPGRPLTSQRFADSGISRVFETRSVLPPIPIRSRINSAQALEPDVARHSRRSRVQFPGVPDGPVRHRVVSAIRSVSRPKAVDKLRESRGPRAAVGVERRRTASDQPTGR